jgi:DNA-binding IclR family transcriptional regulator
MNELILSRICTGRGGAYLDALDRASREELEEAERRVRRDHDADSPMDALRRLEQIRRAMDARP